MGVGQSKLCIEIKGNPKMKTIVIRDIFAVAVNRMPRGWGRFSFHLVWSREQISFYVRRADDQFEKVMYAIRKPNGNFRIFKRLTTDNPIGYVKRTHGAYKLYAEKKRQSYRGKIVRQNGATSIEIPGHDRFTSSDFVSPSRKPIMTDHKNVRIDSDGNLVWATYKLRRNNFRLDCRYRFSWIQAFAFAVVVWHQ